jgi:hypothetical protein
VAKEDRMFYTVTVTAWIVAVVAVTEFGIFGLRREPRAASKKPYGCC